MSEGLRSAERDIFKKDLLGILRPYFLQKVVVQKHPAGGGGGGGESVRPSLEKFHHSIVPIINHLGMSFSLFHAENLITPGVVMTPLYRL